MKKSDFYYDLPEELIAQVPLQDRTASRLMVLNKESGEIQHRHFRDILEYLQPGDCMILNDTKGDACKAAGRAEGHRNPCGAPAAQTLPGRNVWRRNVLGSPGASGAESTSRTSPELRRRNAGGRGPGNRRGRKPNRSI